MRQKGAPASSVSGNGSRSAIPHGLACYCAIRLTPLPYYQCLGALIKGRLPHHASGAARRLHASDASRDEAPSEPVALDVALGLARAEKPGDEFAAHVHDLTIGVGAQARIGIVQTRRRPGRIERRLLDLVRRRGAFEIAIDAGDYEAVEALHRLAHRFSIAWT